MEPLIKSRISRGSQRPALALGVAVPIAIVEAFVVIAGIYAIGFWIACILPVHFYLKVKTGDDFNWMKRAWANFIHARFAVSNKHLHGKGVITFTASTARRKGQHARF